MAAYDGKNVYDISADIGFSAPFVNEYAEYGDQKLLFVEDGVTGESKLLTYNAAEPSYDINFSANTDHGVKLQDIRSSNIDLDIATLDFTAAGAGDTLAKIDAAIDQMEVYERQLSTSSILIQTRMDFTETMSTSFTEMYDKLTLVDTNEEAANLMALQTQQQLMMNALSFGMDSQASLLSLFR
ncbi:MAG: hypothetical protein ACTSXQ_05935 [Alphaproteobacteria bacterium]